ncbi:MAG: Fic family protein [Planctomycetaceae bacterium]
MTPHIPDSLPLNCLDWTRFISLIGSANAELARYDATLQAIVNPQVLLSPLTTQEAVLSSKIEGTQTSLEEVLQYDASLEVAPERRNDMLEVLNYRKAMREAIHYMQKRPVCLDLVLKLQDTLLAGVRGQELGRGKLRKLQNWIGVPDSTVQTAKFVPPDPVMLPQHITNWENYIHFHERDRLVQLAIIHAQFEILHPFNDGNGRVGRMILPLVLYGNGLLSSPMFYLSGYLERHRETYYERLYQITKSGQWDEWVLFFLTGITEQAKENSKKARAILQLYEQMKTRVPAVIATQFTIQTIDALFDRPIFVTTDFVQRSGIPRASAMRILRALQDNAILAVVREASGRRPAILVFQDLIELAEGRK